MTKPQVPLSHVSEDGTARMVDVSLKPTTIREAAATATLRMTGETLSRLSAGTLSKGEVLNTARIAGILGAKSTSHLIPMTHSIPLTHVGIEFEIRQERGELVINTVVRCEGKTGVEIEAMTACSIAALTIYDMCKSAEKGIVIDNLHLTGKSGGRSGTWESGSAPGPQDNRG